MSSGGLNTSGGSFGASPGLSQAQGRMGFVPMINEDELTAMDEQIDSRSPPSKAQRSSSPTNRKEGGMADLNEISAINNTTAQDTSQNIS